MSDEIDDGGAAFPGLKSLDPGAPERGVASYTAHSAEGMSLRDWFAGQALAGLCANSIAGEHHRPPNLVADAYQIADTMLAARKVS